jgi:hypothetical protein
VTSAADQLTIFFQWQAIFGVVARSASTTCVVLCQVLVVPNALKRKCLIHTLVECFWALDAFTPKPFHTTVVMIAWTLERARTVELVQVCPILALLTFVEISAKIAVPEALCTDTSNHLPTTFGREAIDLIVTSRADFATCGIWVEIHIISSALQ